MPNDNTVKSALDRIEKALTGLESAIESRSEKERDYAEAEDEVKRMNEDRSRLAEELDQAEDRGNRLEEANREVSRRLVTAMETIRVVLDR